MLCRHDRRAHVTDAIRKEREPWGIADVATRPVMDHLPKEGIWWSLFHVPTGARSRMNHCLTGGCRQPARGVEQPSPWPPLWTAVRSVAEFMPFHRHAPTIRRMSSLQGSAIGCPRKMGKKGDRLLFEKVACPLEESYASSSETACNSRPITPPTRVPFILINCRSEPMLSSISLT